MKKLFIMLIAFASFIATYEAQAGSELTAPAKHGNRFSHGKKGKHGKRVHLHRHHAHDKKERNSKHGNRPGAKHSRNHNNEYRGNR